MLAPLYTAANCRAAYQLHWSLTLFAAQSLPEKNSWWQALAQATESDGIRLLEYGTRDSRVIQFFVSSQPQVSPSEIVRSIKGRLQYLVRDAMAQLWRRHYAITSVGDANHNVLQRYVGRQVQHHPMADTRVVDRLTRFQYYDESVDLALLRGSSHGKFTYGLHVVLETTEHLGDTREEWLAVSRAMLIAACRRKGWLLSRVGLVGSAHSYRLWRRRSAEGYSP
jgi:hypothetical protein